MWLLVDILSGKPSEFTHFRWTRKRYQKKLLHNSSIWVVYQNWHRCLIPIHSVIQDFFRLQGIKVLWRLQFLEYLRTLSLKFQKAGTKIEVVLTLSCWLSQLNWDSQLGRLRTILILVRGFWNFKLKVLKYSRNCNLHNTLIPWSLKNPESPTLYISVTSQCWSKNCLKFLVCYVSQFHDH